MAKDLQVSDIVSVKTMLEVAKIVRLKAAEIAKRVKAPLQSSRKTGNVYSPNLIGIKQPQTTKNQIVIDLTLTDVAMSFEKGGKPHQINAKNKEYLVFDGTNNFAGQMIFTKSVNHPGSPKRPFLEPAKRQTAKQRRELLEREAGRNIRTIISGMKRVV